MKHLFKIFLLLGLFSLTYCSQQPEPITPDPTQWYCATIADQQNDPTDTTEAHQRAVGYTNKWWPVGYQFKVGFLGNRTTQQTDLVKSVAAEWAQSANVKFTFPETGPYDVRISFNSSGGAWSYVGIDCKNIAQSSPTMNLGWYARDAYLHEFGHTLGLLHEHQNPTSPIKWNEAAVIKDLSGPPNNWTEAMIRFNVLNPYPLPNVITTALDKASIMMYPIPLSWTLDGFSSPGGQVLSSVDKIFINARYPFTQPPTTGSVTLTKAQIDAWLANQAKIKAQSDSISAAVARQAEYTKIILGRN